MASQPALVKIAAAATAAVLLAVTLNFPLAGFQDEKEGSPEEKRLIQSLEGRALFQAHCAACHGKTAKGGGPAAAALKTQPPDLTRISQRNGGKFPLSRIEKTISGDDVVKSHGSREMPIWGPIFAQIAWDQDLGRVRIYNLTKYLESLQKK